MKPSEYRAKQKEAVIRAGIAKGYTQKRIAEDAEISVPTLRSYCAMLGIVTPYCVPKKTRRTSRQTIWNRICKILSTI